MVFLILVNFVLWLIAAVFLSLAEPYLGIYWFVVGYPTSLIAWRFSRYFSISHSDTFFRTDWEVFKTQLKWSNGVGTAVASLGILIMMILFS